MHAQTIYLACIIGGIALLLSSIIFIAADDFFDFAAFDLFSLDLGDFDLDILPVSMKSLCLAATVFGSVSMLMLEKPPAVRHVTAGVCAYLGAFLVQNITGFLKNHQAEADTLESICSREQGYGSVASSEQDRSVLTMTAKSFDGSAITAGTKVDIVKVADHVAVVMPVIKQGG